MTKKKHPHTRAERLALKELDDTKKERAQVRRRFLQSLRDQETEDELRKVARGLNTTPNDP